MMRSTSKSNRLIEINDEYAVQSKDYMTILLQSEGKDVSFISGPLKTITFINNAHPRSPKTIF